MSTVLSRFFELERKEYGKAEYTVKTASTLMKILAFYIRLFNPRFMARYTTVLGMTTYFPERKANDPESCVRTEFHENVHKWDRHREGIKFNFKYAFPQILAAPFIVAAVILGGPLGWAGFGTLLALLHVGLVVLAVSAGNHRGDDHPVPSKAARAAAFALTGTGAAACVLGSVLGGGFLSLFWAPAALFISPWPIKAWWRRDYEIRGYTATLYRIWIEYGVIWDNVIPHMVKAFTGSAYWFMETDGKYIEEELQFQMLRLQNNEDSFLKWWAWCRKRGWSDGELAEPYRMISKFMKEEGMVYGA